MSVDSLGTLVSLAIRAIAALAASLDIQGYQVSQESVAFQV